MFSFVTIGSVRYPSNMFLRFAVDSAPRIMLIRAKESLHVELILLSLKTAITDVDVVVKCFLFTSLLSMIDAVVGEAVSAASSENGIFEELVADVVAVP